MRATLAELLPGLLCVVLLVAMLAFVLLAVGTARVWSEQEWRRARRAVLLVGLWGVAYAVRSASPSLLLGLLILFWAEPVEPGAQPARWRRKLGTAAAVGVAFFGLALLWQLLSLPSVTRPWKALASLPFLAYGGMIGILLRRGLRDWRRRRAEGSSWKLPPAILLLSILGIVLAGLWDAASGHFWWLIQLGPKVYVASFRPSDSLLAGSAWLTMQWMDLAALVVLALWLFQHLWERLVLGGNRTAPRVDVRE